MRADEEPEVGPDPLPPPTREEQEAAAWEHWYQRALAAEKRGLELQAAVEDAIETLEAMDLHNDNPLYDRLRAVLEVTT